MPLSVAHPAAVLPLRRTALPLSALVVGSLAPDLEYLFHLSPTGTIGHTIPGLFLFCLPAGFATLFLLHRLWAPLANAMMGRAGTEAPFLPLSRFASICGALLVGALSHVAWDSFTHVHGWTTEHVPLLRMPIAHTAWGTLRVYKLLQHASTAAGLAVVARAIAPPLRLLSSEGWRVLAVLSGMGVAGGAAIGSARVGLPSDYAAFRIFVGVSMVGSFAAFIAALTGAAIIWRVSRNGLFKS